MKKINRYILMIMISIALVSQLFVVYAEEANSNTTEIKIFHTNDIHGRHAYEEKGKEFIQISHLATLKKNTPNSVLVDAGDNIHGLPFVNINRGKDAIELMKSAKYDYMAPGNHDFNYGQDELIVLSKLATQGNSDYEGMKMLSANVFKNGSPLLQNGSSNNGMNDIKVIDGVKVGFFGLTTQETAYKTNPNGVLGIDFKNPIEVAKEQVNNLKQQGAEVIIAIAHIGVDESSSPKSTDIANQVQGIDVIIDGHSHTELDGGKKVGNTLIASANEYLNYIGEVTIKVNKDTKEIESSARLIGKDEALKLIPDEVTNQKIEEIKKAQEPLLSAVVGNTTTVLDGERVNVRSKETNLGNLINDAVIYETKADIAINNGGNIRATIGIGNITKGQVISVLPFGNTTITKELTGTQVKDVLEHGVKDYPDLNPGFTHVAGITYSFDPKQPAGERIVSIKKDGKDLDMSKTYIVATNDFLAVGGDEFPHFNDAKTINEFGGLEESVMAYIEKLKTVSYEVEGRITMEPKKVEETVNQDAISTVINIISKLPKQIKLEDKELILEARRNYDKLTDKEKELVVNYEELLQAEAKLKNLEEANNSEESKINKEAVNNVINLIGKLSKEIKLEDKNLILEARKNYDKLTNEEKRLVTNYDKLVKAEAKLKDLEESLKNKPSVNSPTTGDVGIAACIFGLVASSAFLYANNKKRR